MIAGGFGNRLRASWDFVLDASLILWICRVSAVSAVAGLLLFGFSDQARDTFLEVRGLRPSNWQNLLFWVAFFLFVILFWAMPVHFAARRNLELDPIFQKEASTPSLERQRRRRDVALWMPRLLAFLCLVSVSVGASFAQAVVRVADSNDTSVNLYAEAQAQAGYLAVIAAGLAIIIVILLAARRELFKGVPRYVGTTLLASLFLVVVVLFFAPKQLLEGLTRAPLIPLLLGGWVPLFAWLANKGRIYHAPFIAFTLIVIQLTTYFGDNHEIRTITISSQGLPAPSGTPQRNLGVTRYTLQEKICEWQTVLGCRVYSDRLPPSGPVCDTSRIKAITKVCPRPIIIAASGGASRAGFYTAAILGKLVDLTSEPGYRNFTDQLFAISSVSGSSVGAAFFVAALRDMPPDKTGTRMKTPCVEDAKSPLFFRNRPPQTWRECMELLLSGDFLSSPLFTYLYGDALGGLAGILGHPDRAVALETAWEGQYRRYVRAQTTGGQSSGLETPFLTLAGFQGRVSARRFMASTPFLQLDRYRHRASSRRVFRHNQDANAS